MFLYIDPGTGSMLFSILIGVVSTLIFFAERLFVRLKFVFSGGKARKIKGEKIPFLIFSDHKRYWNVFKPICDEFERRAVDLVFWTASADDPALSAPYTHVRTEFIGEGNKAFARLNLLNASIVLSTTPGLDVYQWKRSRHADFYVHIRHSVDEPVGYRMFGCDCYDAILLTGSHQEHFIRLLEKLRNQKPKECVITGCTYFDSMKKRLDSARSKPKSENKTILLAPTWGKSGILAKYGEKIISALIATGFKIIIRAHPQSFTAEKDLIESLFRKFPETDLLKWNRDNDNFDVLNEADLLISDFSGIVFDFTLVFDKPLIYADTDYDSSPYDAAWIKEPLWRFEALKKLGRRLAESDFPDLKSIINSVIEDKSFQEAREKIRGEVWHFQGKSAEKTADYLIKKHKEIF